MSATRPCAGSPSSCARRRRRSPRTWSSPTRRREGYGSPVLDAVREGYLLHYGEPRLLAGHDDDLAVLAGDYLYALGIERLAASGDCAAVLELAELIGACAQRHVEGREDEVARALARGGRRHRGRVRPQSINFVALS